MPYNIVLGDITYFKCDAIVNAANSSLLGGGGVDGAIHRAAGKGLLEECRKLGGCKTGQAKITGGYKLPCKYVIHTVGPVWRGGSNDERELLYSCYINSMKLAKEYNCESIAFPLISSGIYGYPKRRALETATDAIRDFLADNDMEITMVLYERMNMQEDRRFNSLDDVIKRNYIETDPVRLNTLIIQDVGLSSQPKKKHSGGFWGLRSSKSSSECEDSAELPRSDLVLNKAKVNSLSEALDKIDESFTEMLMRKIDEKGLTDPQCYKRANIDRKLFSKIRSDKFYKPSKQTVIALAVSLELSVDETKEMLMKAGYALSHSSKFDIIVEYFISGGVYDIYEINEALFEYDQKLLGA